MISSQKDKKYKSGIVAITGIIGSGKSEGCTFLENEFGYKNIKASAIMKKVLGINDTVYIARSELQDRGFKFVNSNNGDYELAKAITKEIDINKNNVIDGLRCVSTLIKIENLIKLPIFIVYISTSNKNAYKNYLTRSGEVITFAEFSNLCTHPIEQEIRHFIPISDIVIRNNGTIESYFNKLRLLFSKSSTENTNLYFH